MTNQSDIKKLAEQMAGSMNSFDDINEPPRLYRRLIYLSQAAMPDRVKLS